MARIGQIGIYCKDLDKSVQWYKDAFGLTEMPREHGGKLLVMRGGGVDIELIQSEGEEGKEPGLNHFGFFTRDCDSVAAQVKKAGGDQLKWIYEPQERNKGIRFAFLIGPDGTRLEILQYTGDGVGK